MTTVDRWLLPDGVEDILPHKAARVELMRRKLLDLFASWGFELIIPPLIEYTESLSVGLGQDIDLLTFKVTDQLSGRSMGIRADMTPQSARIDAHSLNRQGLSRLCYAGHVLHAKPKSAMATRSPIQAGVELYGEESTDADIEVISLMLAAMRESRLPALHIDLGHVGIFRGIAAAAGLSQVQERELFDLLQAKAVTDIGIWLKDNQVESKYASMLAALPQLAGDQSVLEQARVVLAAAPAQVLADLDTLASVSSAVQVRYPEANLYFDLGELRGYHYHTGVVFAAFAPGYGAAIANGGRYDKMGEEFGSSRAATGFSIDITALERLVPEAESSPGAIFAPASEDSNQWQQIVALREKGETVVCGFAGQDPVDIAPHCDRQLVLEAGEYRVKSL